MKRFKAFTSDCVIKWLLPAYNFDNRETIEWSQFNRPLIHISTEASSNENFWKRQKFPFLGLPTTVNMKCGNQMYEKDVMCYEGVDAVKRMIWSQVHIIYQIILKHVFFFCWTRSN